MSVRSICVLILAFICGTSAALAVSRMRQSGDVTTVPVVAAKTEIPRGSMITADMLEIRDWPRQMAPDKGISTIEEVVGRATVVPVFPGDLVLSTKLADKDAGRGLAPLIPDGMRAYTIQTSKSASSVAGFVLPKNRVDVLLTLKGEPHDASGGGLSTTLLEAVEILAVDQQLDAPATNKTTDMRSVTLLVSPRQAALLDLGQNMGQLTLSLRNSTDKSELPKKAFQTEPATLDDLRQKPARAVDIAGSERPTYKIHTLRGSHAGEVTVSLDN